MATALKPPAQKVPKLDAANVEEDGEQEADKLATEEDQVHLEKVVSIQHEIDELNERASEEILHVEQKYNKLRQPHYQKRSEAIAAIPDFWHTTLINNSQFADLLTGEDEAALQYLTTLTVEEYEDPKSGCKISFHFRPNPYFENEVLSKEVVMEAPGETTVTDTQILWKEGKDITVRNSTTEEATGRKRGLEEQPSFFSWFSAESPLDEPGEIIRDDIWPNPLQFYLDCSNAAALNETFDEEEEEEEEEEEDGLDEDEDDDDDPDVIDLSDDEDEV